MRVLSHHLRAAQRVPHIRGGVQEEPGHRVDNEADRQVARKGDIPVQEAEGHHGVEKRRLV